MTAEQHVEMVTGDAFECTRCKRMVRTGRRFMCAQCYTMAMDEAYLRVHERRYPPHMVVPRVPFADPIKSGAIPTKAADGSPNGWLVPIWNALERPDLRPEQVYLTVVLPGCVKGPHLHMKRRGVFCCVSGNALIVVREIQGDGALICYREITIGEDYQYGTALVSPGIPAAIYCVGDKPAFVLNMPSPAWSKDDPDEHEVTDWNYRP